MGARVCHSRDRGNVQGVGAYLWAGGDAWLGGGAAGAAESVSGGPVGRGGKGMKVCVGNIAPPPIH
eukprot:1158156-Pelagomonas_calceolata.AAC.4